MFKSNTSTQVHVLTFLSKTHFDKGRFAVSVEVIRKKTVDSVKQKRKAEEQVYIEHENVVGSCSPEFELPLKEKKCDIQFSISGALKPRSELEPGEDILEYSESLGECRKHLSLVPTYDEKSEGNATIKFKVDGRVKHTVTIHEVPTIRTVSISSNSSSFADVTGATSRQTSVFSSSVSSQSFGSLDPSLSYSNDADDSVDAGTVREHNSSSSGDGHCSGSVEADRIPDDSLDRYPPLNQAMGNLVLNNPRHPGPNVVPPVNPAGPQAGQFVHLGVNYVRPQVGPQDGPQAVPPKGPQVVPPAGGQNIESAYDKILCNESLSTLAWALPPADANRLLIGLRVPNPVLQTNKSNHPGDVVSANFQSFLHWRSQRRSQKQEHEASNQNMYEDLLMELHDMGRKDLKVVLKRTLEANKKLEKNDFSHL